MTSHVTGTVGSQGRTLELCLYVSGHTNVSILYCVIRRTEGASGHGR